MDVLRPDTNINIIIGYNANGLYLFSAQLLHYVFINDRTLRLSFATHAFQSPNWYVQQLPASIGQFVVIVRWDQILECGPFQHEFIQKWLHIEYGSIDDSGW